MAGATVTGAAGGPDGGRRAVAFTAMAFTAMAVTALAILALGVPAEVAARAQGVERVGDAAVVNGVPRGIFVSRSLLTGRAVCLLFLSEGRVTRVIPRGGLERFDWAAHRAAHERDSGTWAMRGGAVRITWGDGGVQEGPLTETPTGIEFAGKRYWRPMVVDARAVAGAWESARGTAIAGGEGVNAVATLAIEGDGAFRWIGTTGGAVAGRTAADQREVRGTLRVSGATLIFRGAGGAETSRTFLVAPGEPVTAFTLDGEVFTRVR